MAGRMLLFLLLAIGLAGCQANPDIPAAESVSVPQGTVPAPAEDGGDYLVWSSLLADWYPPGQTQISAIIIADRTDTADMTAGDGELSPYLREKLPGLDPATWRNYLVRRTQAQPLAADRFIGRMLAAPVRLISDAELAKMFAEPRGWETFHARYPRSSGIIALTLPGYNATRTQALMHISSTAGPLAGSGHLVLLQLKDGAWYVVAKAMTWIS